MFGSLQAAAVDIEGYAKEKMRETYQRIIRRVKDSPASAHSYEQIELLDCFEKVKAYARKQYVEAMAAEGIKYPDLLWTERVEPEITEPEFKYCTVFTSEDQAGTREPEPNAKQGIDSMKVNPQKFSRSKLAFPAGMVGVGGAAILAGKVLSESMAAALTIGGTVLIVSGIAIGVYVLFRSGKQIVPSNSNPVRKGMDSFDDVAADNAGVGLDSLMDGQYKYNLSEFLRWLKKLEKLVSDAVYFEKNKT